MTKYRLKPTASIKTADNLIYLKEEMLDKLRAINSNVIIIETYPGVRLDKIKEEIIKYLNPDKVIWSEDFALQGKEFRDFINPEITDDRVFGYMSSGEYASAFDFKSISDEVKSWKDKEKIIVFGTGASYFDKQAPVVYVDISRWEAQVRYNNNENVYFGGTLEDEKTKNFKRGYFLEWRWADRIKKEVFDRVEYFIDSVSDNLKMISKDTMLMFLENVASRPFRTVPYFDAGVWGGNWMEEKFGLGKNKFNRWAWGFDGVPEENSIIIENNNKLFEMPAINLCFWETNKLLGKRVNDIFLGDFPIRFDFLDTIGGQNLSLQVHPTKEYIKEKFGMHYTQSESYYILEATEDASCYLGVVDGVEKTDLFDALENGQKTGKFEAEKYVNRIPAKKHDHFSHPAGVIHSSASGCVVLEISSTPYIFTFKLWDWARLGLNGKPRPINLQHGKEVIDMTFGTEKTLKELYSPFETIHENESYKIEKTGLHEKQFIKTLRHSVKSGEIKIPVHDSVNMLNLVEGESVIISSVDNSFEPLEVHYAETFIVPHSCKEFTVKSTDNKPFMLLQAFVK